MTTLIPNPFDSDSQYYRFHYIDIIALEDSELQDELWALRPHLWGLPANHWLRERVSRLEAELQKRKFNVGSEASKRQTPKQAEGVKL
jgi:hypothetical protein